MKRHFQYIYRRATVCLHRNDFVRTTSAVASDGEERQLAIMSNEEQGLIMAIVSRGVSTRTS